jgi:hypothetical protein
MLAYRLEMHTPEQIAAQDPFEGAGVRLFTTGLAQAPAEPVITELFGTVPYVTFPGCVWLDGRAFTGGVTAETARATWRERLLPVLRDGGDGVR